MSQPSIVEYFAEHDGHRCGYCGNKDTNFSHGMWAHQMTVQDYQDLIDRGWRRSGKYCYKPTMNRTCCPQYPIRCNALEFKPSKSHKKAIKKVNKFLISGIVSEMSSSDTPMVESETGAETPEVDDITDKSIASSVQITSVPEQKAPGKSISDSQVQHKTSKKPLRGSASESAVTETQLPSQASRKIPPKPGSGADPSKPPCRKAKALRAERRLQKSSQETRDKKAGTAPKTAKNEPKSLEDLLSEADKAENPAHRLELRLIRSNPPSSEFSQTFSASHKVYQAYQVAVHKDPPGKVGQKQYTRFLCDSPLMETGSEEGRGPPLGYGSFHQQYLLDGKIIAVGVLDILPSCVSSVYLYYDPKYSFLGLGVYSALRELALVRELNSHASLLAYYYMGFYIQSCPKMRYKGQYWPSYLVCPESYHWVPIEQCRPKLDESKYARLSLPDTEDPNHKIDLNQVLCLHKGSMLPYVFYKALKLQSGSTPRDEPEVEQYAGFVGKVCAERMCLYRK